MWIDDGETLAGRWQDDGGDAISFLATNFLSFPNESLFAMGRHVHC